MAAKIQFGYWNVQGVGQPIRMLLKYVNEDYDDTVYALDANESDKNHWPSNKDHLGLDFPNLPYYIDDQIKSSQSGTILRYLGRKYKMAGANEQETTTIEMLIDTATDLKTIIGFPAYTSADDEASLRAQCSSQAENKFKHLSKFLGKKKFLMGDHITIADFPIYDAINWYLILDEPMVKGFPELIEYCGRLEADPKIKAFLDGDKFFKNSFLDIAKVQLRRST